MATVYGTSNISMETPFETHMTTVNGTLYITKGSLMNANMAKV
jgi:hypothetical protein